MKETILIRYGEIGLKGKNRGFFEKMLVRNIERTLSLGPGHVRRLRGRIFLEGIEAPFATVRGKLQRVFGIHSFSRIEEAPLEREAILEGAVALFERLRATKPSARSFAVRVRRANKRFPATSMEIAREAGAAVLARAPEMSVDLEDPDLAVEIEIGERAAAFPLDRWPGPGGLPVGVGGRVMLLISGGIDSPVAGWLAMKRGCTLECVYFHTPPYTGGQVQEKVATLCRHLHGFHPAPLSLTVVHFTPILEAIQRSCPTDLGVVLQRRMMHRIAERLAERKGARALVTGENLGQVASQTLENLCRLDEVVSMPILRPLITFDKAETIELARRIGTYETSILPYSDCCALFVPSHPQTHASREGVERAEASLDVEALLLAALDRVETIEID